MASRIGASLAAAQEEREAARERMRRVREQQRDGANVRSNEAPAHVSGSDGNEPEASADVPPAAPRRRCRGVWDSTHFRRTISNHQSAGPRGRSTAT
jgi:hypothetical protein